MSILGLTFISCGASQHPLNGTWTGIFNGNGEQIKLSITFADDLCFIGYEVENETSIRRTRYTYENGIGSLPLSPVESTRFTVNNNILNFTHNEAPVILFRDTFKAVPSALRGIWKDPEGWVMIFINDKAYVNLGSTTDYGIFSFNKNEGYFEGVRYGADVRFTVKGNTLNVTTNGYPQTFSRVNN